MKKFNLWLNENSSREDLVSAYQERMMYLFAIVFFVILFPVMIFNFRRGQAELGAGIACLLIIIALNATAAYYQKSLPIAKTIFIVGLAAVVGIALVSRGVHGTYWAFPVVIFICFSVPYKLAKLFTVIFFVYISSLSFYLLDFRLALRFVFGLFATILFMNIFLGIIEKLQEKLVEQSLRDPLTGAFNRRQMVPSLEEALERKRRTLAPASILIFDIDNFKSINDNYGHAGGDHVLKEAVSLINQRARRFDQLFRIGGEEFMLFLPDTPGNGALILAQEICALISNADFIEGCRVTVSIGLSELEPGESIDQWMKHGDNALYSAKENGRNQVFSRTIPIIPDYLNIGQDNFSVHPALDSKVYIPQ